jgi:hypothetical protein
MAGTWSGFSARIKNTANQITSSNPEARVSVSLGLLVKPHVVLAHNILKEET